MHILSCLPRTVFKKGKIEIDYFDKYKCLHLNWAGNITSDVYSSVMDEMLYFSKELEVEFWLLDARDGDNFEIIDCEWATRFFTVDLPQVKIKKIARIAGYDFNFETWLSGLISSIIENKTVCFRFKYHPDTDHALAWFLDGENKEKS